MTISCNSKHKNLNLRTFSLKTVVLISSTSVKSRCHHDPRILSHVQVPVRVEPPGQRSEASQFQASVIGIITGTGAGTGTDTEVRVGVIIVGSREVSAGVKTGTYLLSKS